MAFLKNCSLIEAKAAKEEGKISLEFVSVEWDYQVKEFTGKLLQCTVMSDTGYLLKI
jgi:hypothetical protein